MISLRSVPSASVDEALTWAVTLTSFFARH
jgi:hypothetical protein